MEVLIVVLRRLELVGFGVWGLGFGVWGLGFGVWGLWWHRVDATAPFNMLLNYWWDSASVGPDAPYTTLLLAMTAIAHRPERERAAWRAYFDHYVFRPDGHPLAHLPEERHGALGRGQLGRIRAVVMKLLRG